MIARPLKAFAENPYVNLISGLVLFITAGIEIVRSFGDGEIGVHHGVMVFAIMQILQTLPHCLHAAEEVSKIRDPSSRK